MLSTLNTGTWPRARVCEDLLLLLSSVPHQKEDGKDKAASPLWLRLGEHREQSSSGEGKAEVRLPLHKAL